MKNVLQIAVQKFEHTLMVYEVNQQGNLTDDAYIYYVIE